MPFKFFGHPFHPMFVHFPIAFFTAYVGILIFRAWRERPTLEEAAHVLLILGLVSLLFVIPAGINDNEGIANIFKDRAVLYHVIAGVTLTALFLVHYLMRVRLKEAVWDSPARVFFLGSALLGFMAMGVAGFLGANLVYK